MWPIREGGPFLLEEEFGEAVHLRDQPRQAGRNRGGLHNQHSCHKVQERAALA